MSNKEFFLHTFEDELPRFERVLKAVPSENLDYKPDPKSKSGLELVMMFVMEIGALNALADTGVIDFTQAPKMPPITTPAEAAGIFVDHANKL